MRSATCGPCHGGGGALRATGNQRRNRRSTNKQDAYTSSWLTGFSTRVPSTSSKLRFVRSWSGSRPSPSPCPAAVSDRFGARNVPQPLQQLVEHRNRHRIGTGGHENPPANLGHHTAMRRKPPSQADTVNGRAGVCNNVCPLEQSFPRRYVRIDGRLRALEGRRSRGSSTGVPAPKEVDRCVVSHSVGSPC